MDRRRPHPLDLVALGLLVLGLLCWATGALPTHDASAIIDRIRPILGFLFSVVILAELTSKAQTFDVLATRLAILARGRFAVLFLLCVLLAVLVTVGLNLDTTAVLLTPIMLALADRAGVPPLPLAVTTAFLANTASLLLPVGNLTNLLAADRVALPPAEFAARMAAPEAVSVAATMAVLWIFFWRRKRRGGIERFTPPAPFRPADPTLCAIAGVACALFVIAIVAGAPLQLASAAAAGVTVLAFLARRREELRWSLLPWRLLANVTGMFLVVQTLSVHGLDTFVGHLIGTDGGFVGQLRAAGTGLGLSNVVNNLPAYIAGEAAIPPGNHTQLLALLIGVNAGPISTPWGSLAMLLWFERCDAAGLAVPKRAVAIAGTVLAILAVGGATLALAAT
ncbi:SLC13 family permease [Actinospica sp.]|uniref:SLC13 family permease n=1 Tax=Actinospica sp. TaxID=1872142 RepID=UPI002B9C4875|nr:SLC13 family permease [Actinospica sp.]HWG28038.1 SLC13 family permease [Actinospica sp.]